jgi:hypothetical protein
VQFDSIYKNYGFTILKNKITFIKQIKAAYSNSHAMIKFKKEIFLFPKKKNHKKRNKK